jgi:GT2 family glycosyltransferase
MLRKALAFLDHLQGVDLEVVIVDHMSKDPDLLAYYQELDRRGPFKLVRYDRGFNYSLMINAGVAASSRPVIVMMNNDVEITRPEALVTLLQEAMRPEVGVAGSRLLYPDETIQHCGVTLLEGGHADHILRYVRCDDPAYQNVLSEVCEYQAVTGALMACRREVFDAVEGFNEVYLPIEYNDIDFCLKVREQGLKVICLPLKGVYHHESVSRGRDLDVMGRLIRSEASRYMSRRWREEYSKPDPFLDPDSDYFPNRLHPASDGQTYLKII